MQDHAIEAPWKLHSAGGEQCEVTEEQIDTEVMNNRVVQLSRSRALELGAQNVLGNGCIE